MQQKRNKKALIIGILAAVLVLTGVLAVLLAGIPAWTEQEPTVSTTETTAPVYTGPLEVYWNLDLEQYEGKSEAGMSSRMPESDGFFHVRFFKDGKIEEHKVADRRIINHLDTLCIMGLVFDENGIVVNVVPVEELPMEKLGWQFYVQSIGGKLLKVNSSNKMNGMEVLLELGDTTAIYDMTGAEGEVGAVVTPIPGDRVYPIVDLEGNVKSVFIYKRDNYMQTAEGACIHCGESVEWKLWVKTDSMPEESGHYQLQNDIQLKSQVSLGEDCKMCLDLNGKVIDGKEGARAVSMHNAGVELAVMDTSEGQKGAIRTHGELAGQGGVMYVRFGAFYLYSGTLDGSQSVNTYAGAVMCINKGAFAYINGGTIKGGTAKYSLDDKGKPGNGMGGNIRILGKLVINDGVITGGKALAYSTRKNGKTTYSRGYGGNIYMGTGGVLEMKGGKVEKGVAGGMGGNIYIDGDCEMTMTGGEISGGKLTTADRNGGNLFVGSKASFKMSGGYIRNGRVYNGGANVYANGKVTISGGQIYGGKVIDKATGAEKKAVHNNLYVVNGDLRISGGKIAGGVTVTDASTTDKNVAKLSLSGNAIIYGAAEGRSNLTLSSSGEKVLIKVGKLGKNAKIGISTTRGVFTQPRDDKEMEHFVSDIPGAEVVYHDGAYALGRVGCVCGKDTHKSFCDGKEQLWYPWNTAGKLPVTSGHYFLTAGVEATAQSSVGADQKVVLDLNGQTVTGSISRIYSVAEVGAALTVTDTKGGGSIKNVNEQGDLGGILLVRTGAELKLLAGTLDASEYTSVNTNGGAAIFVNTGASFTMAGGTVKGGKASVGGAVNIAKDGTMILTGGTVVGGDVGTGKGGSINALGTLEITGGTVKDGKAQYGGNIYAESKVTVSGGEITGGTGTTANLHVVNGELILSGGRIAGGVMVDDRAKDDGIQTVLRLSGKPVVTGAKTNLELSSRGDGVTVYVETMEKDAKVGITAAAGIFTKPCEKANAKYFTGDKKDMDVVWYDGALAVGKAGCMCGKQTHLAGCDKKEHLWMPWAANSKNLPDTAGYWYLTGTMTLKKGAELAADQKVVLDLNGYTATADSFRVYSTHNAGSSLVITDRADGKGTIRVTGENANSGLCVYVRNGDFTLLGGNLDASAAKSTHANQGGIAVWINNQRTFRMSGGTVTGGTTTCNNGGAIEVNSGGTMELHGGTVHGTKAPTQALNGTAINVSGTLKMSGGTVSGGTTTGVGGSICVKGVMELSGGTVTGGTTTGNGGNIYVTDSGRLTMTGGKVEKGSAKYGLNIFVDGAMTMKGGTVQSGNILVLDGEMTLSGGKVLGGLHVDDRSATDSINTLLTISGTPEVAGMTLVDRGASCKLLVGELNISDPIPISAPIGVFATVKSGVDADAAAACFVSKDAAMRVSRQADGLHIVDKNAVYHCLCGQKPHLPGCDGNEHLWKKWAKTNTKLPTTTGYWYLEDSMTLSASADLPADAQVVLDLNGKTATAGASRCFSVHNTGASLVITDSTKDGNGTLKVTGTNSNAGLAIYVRKGDATLIRGNLDVSGATSTNRTGGSAIWINENRTFRMYGGTVIGGNNTNASACGGAICVGAAGATMELRGGTVKGGSVTATGKGQCLYVISTGTLKMTGGKVEGDVYVDGTLNLSGNVTIKSLTAANKGLFTVGQLKEGSSIGITGSGVVAENVQTDVSAYFHGAESGKQAVYNAEEKTLTIQ